MAEAGARKGGRKGRKIGRQRKSPSHMRYTASKRWIENKSARAKRNLKKQKKVMEHAERARLRTKEHPYAR